jgi:lysophospholipase L1-like esterase
MNKARFIMGMMLVISCLKKDPVTGDGDGFANSEVLSGIADDFAAAKAGTKNVKIIQIGDSNIEYGHNNAHAWRVLLNSDGYAIKGAQWSGIFSASNPFYNFRNWFGVGWADLNEWEDEDSTPNCNGNSVTLHTNKSTASSDPYVAINYAGPGTAGNVFKIYYKPQIGGGTITLRKNIDGAVDLPSYGTAGTLWGTIDTSDTTGSISSDLKVVELDATGVYSFGLLPTNNVEIYGLQLYGTDTKGIHFIPLGHSGAGAVSYAARTPNALWRAQLSEIGKTLAVGDKTYVFVNLGTNDFRGVSSTAAQYKTYMQTNITNILSALPTAKLILQAPPRHDYGSWGGDETRRAEFNSKLLELANENGCVYWDLDYIINSNYALYTDGLHWTLEGNTALANSFIAKFGL